MNEIEKVLYLNFNYLFIKVTSSSIFHNYDLKVQGNSEACCPISELKTMQIHP